MCGIVGAVADRNIVPILVDGLERLKYRGYDSAGLALITSNGLERVRVQGKIHRLVEQLDRSPLMGPIGIAHTRWATHGAPSEQNAHPHFGGQRIALVHNGIIENYRELKQMLADLGYHFSSDTDSEVVAVYIEHMLKTHPLKTAIQMVLARLKGAYAFCVIDAQQPDTLIAARFGSPLVIGIGKEEHFIASDPLALQSVCQQFIDLEEGDIAEIQLKSLLIENAKGEPVTRETRTVTWQTDIGDRQHYEHFMQKEIFEQPAALKATLHAALQAQGNTLSFVTAFGKEAKTVFARAKKVHIIACGTSYFAGFVGKYWIERFTDMSCEVEIASEFRYRPKVIPADTLFIAISQSGETADTLAAIKEARQSPHCLGVLCIGNVPNSAMMRNTDLRFVTLAGPEIGVCSTKAFTTQLLALLLFTIETASPQKLTPTDAENLIQTLQALPETVEKLLQLDPVIQSIAQQLMHQHNVLFLGRGPCFPIALEGALKLKELSYIYAEAYPGGELKHGPLALVDATMPVIVLAANDGLWEKLKSNIEEVRARGGRIVAFIDETLTGLDPAIQTIRLPALPPIVAPIAYVVPLQLLAYHIAVLKGTDVDQPRNLAKSVTVE